MNALSISLQKISDQTLLQKTESLVSQERVLVSELLWHLREIRRRRVFADLGFDSLFSYCTKKLGYSPEQTYRRLRAMELLEDIPQAESQLKSGELNLSQLCLAQQFFLEESKQQPLSKEDKVQTLQRLQGQSVRDTQKILLSKSSSPSRLPKESHRQVTAKEIELKLTISNVDWERIDRLKGLLAHKFPNLKTGELFGYLCEVHLQTLLKQKVQETPKAKTPAEKREKLEATETSIQTLSHFSPKFQVSATSHKFQPTCGKPSFQPVSSEKPLVTKSKSRFISAKLRREIWQQNKGRCGQCQSVYALEIEHVIPVAKGGQSDLKNLTLLCRSCNQRSAIKEFGLQKMGDHFRPNIGMELGS